MNADTTREFTDAERDAGILSHLRDWWLTVARRDKYTLGHEEVDLLFRVAGERDALRRETCAEPSPPDPKYVVRKCADCHHEPHGIRMLCINRFCACRNERPTR